MYCINAPIILHLVDISWRQTEDHPLSAVVQDSGNHADQATTTNLLHNFQKCDTV